LVGEVFDVRTLADRDLTTVSRVDRLLGLNKNLGVKVPRGRRDPSSSSSSAPHTREGGEGEEGRDRARRRRAWEGGAGESPASPRRRRPCLSADGGRRAVDGSGLGAYRPPRGEGIGGGGESGERGKEKENDAWGLRLVVDMEFELEVDGCRETKTGLESWMTRREYSF
jgi:hypothetical protein